MRFIRFIDSVVFRYWFLLLIFLLLLFNRKLPRELKSQYKKLLEEIKYSPSIEKDNRY